jgi:predicted Zn-dependent protease
VLVASVEAGGDEGPFTLSLQEDFLDTLSEDELKAVIAHELGHVWIFTHHPYLQTERLANDIARRLVSRDVLVTVYEKLWKSQGTKGDLVRFVGD